MRFLSLEMQTLNPGSSSPAQLIAVSASGAAGARGGSRDYIGGGRCPPRPPVEVVFEICYCKKLNVWARFRLKKLSV